MTRSVRDGESSASFPLHLHLAEEPPRLQHILRGIRLIGPPERAPVGPGLVAGGQVQRAQHVAGAAHDLEVHIVHPRCHKGRDVEPVGRLPVAAGEGVRSAVRPVCGGVAIGNVAQPAVKGGRTRMTITRAFLGQSTHPIGRGREALRPRGLARDFLRWINEVGRRRHRRKGQADKHSCAIPETRYRCNSPTVTFHDHAHEIEP